MQYVEAPETYNGNAIKVFLAGGIGNCPDWQQEAVGMLAHTELAVFNPRRATFPTPWDRENSRQQIEWEFEALLEAEIILFWFPAGQSMQPIALFELGSHLRSKYARLAIGVEPGYPRLDDIEIQVGLIKGDQYPIFHTLEETCGAVELLASRIDPASRRH